ncbi:hypothetical protein Tco_1215935 [Tanacetum coccineum]
MYFQHPNVTIPLRCPDFWGCYIAFAGGLAIPPDVTTGPTAAPSAKGKSPMVDEEPPVRERSFRQREEDMLGAEAARRLYEEEQAELAREREEQKQKR